MGIKLFTIIALVNFLMPFTSVGQEGQIVFNDEFVDNRSKWDQYITKEAFLGILNDNYVFEHKRPTGAWTSSIPVPFETQGNFVIEADFTKISGIDNHGYGILWGGKDSKNLFVFLISGDGHYQIGKTSNGTFIAIIKWQPSSAISKSNSKNNLQIKKIGREYIFLANSQELARIPYEPLMGSRTGFFINNQIRLKVDKITVKATGGNQSNIVNNQTVNDQAYPPDLSLDLLEFYEPSGNKALDANERGEIRFNLVNKGRGSANSITIKVMPVNSSSEVSFSSNISIEQLPSKMYKKIAIPISAGTIANPGMHQFRIEVSEGNGFDTDPVIINFETKAMDMSDLQVNQVAIDDDSNGDSQGNSNSIIEAGESVEVIAFIQNFGKGSAKNVSAEVSMNSTDMNISYPDKGKVYSMGEILPGDYKKLHFYFYTSKRYAISDIPLTIQISDGTNGMSKSIPLGLKLGKRTQNIVEVNIKKIDEPGKDTTEIRDIEEIVKLTDVDENFPKTTIDGSNTLAIVMGIEDYKYAPDVAYAANDAQTVYKYMKSVFNIPEKNIYYRVNDGATAGEFKKIFADDGWLARRISPGETNVIIYYAGHGAPDAKSKVAYLIPQDIDPNYANTGFSLDDLYGSLGRLQAKSINVYLDACFSGVSRENEPLFAEVRTVVIKPKKSGVPQNTVVFAASNDEQFSSAYPEKYHGLFTYYLLKGLKGEANKADNQLTAQELYDYVNKNVSQQAGFLDKEQNPTFEGLDKNRVILKY